MEKTGWMILHGYEEEPSIIPMDENLREINRILKRTLKATGSKFEFKKVKSSIKESKIFYKSMGIDILPVNFIKENKMEEIIFAPHTSDREIMEKIQKKIKKISPFDLPVSLCYGKADYSKLNESIALPPDSLEYYVASIIYTGILLSNLTTSLTPFTYTKEIARTQLAKGSIESYENTDILPIFFELLSALKKDNAELEFKNLLTNELMQLYASINQLDNYHNNSKSLVQEYQALEYSKKIVSTIKALELFIYYCETTYRNRKDIVSITNMIFNSQLRLEDLLVELNINNLNNGQEAIKELLR